jgi:hypothetical protein|tara:strand:+ start:44 stop:463 length:420 start_codon:yes stop_codon:yes gene_type:complete
MIKDIKILHIDDQGRMSVKFPTGPEKTDLSFNLIQRIMKRILTLKGSDYWYPEIGTNIPELFRFVDIKSKNKIAAFFPIYFKDIEKELLEEQLLLTNLPSVQKLKSLELIDVIFDEVLFGWILRVKVNTEAGTSTTITV